MKTLYLFPDTNVFLQCKPLDQLSWAAMSGFDEIELVVTRPVQAEIDALKGKGNSRQASRARTAAGQISKLLDLADNRRKVRDGRPVVHLRVDQTLRPDKEASDVLDYEQRDDQLVGIVLSFQRANPDQVVKLLTDDSGPKFSAKAVGVRFDSTPAEWFLAPEEDEATKRANALKAELELYKRQEPSFKASFEKPSGDRLEVNVHKYEQLKADEIDDLIARLEAKHPIATDFGEAQAKETELKRPLDIAEFKLPPEGEIRPVTPGDVAQYRKRYDEWIQDCRSKLGNLAEALHAQQVRPEIRVVIENVGSRPAEDALVVAGFEGPFWIGLPKKRDDDEPEKTPYQLGIELASPPRTPRPRVIEKTDVNVGDAIQRLNASGLEASLLSPRVYLPPEPRDPNACYLKVGRRGLPLNRIEYECAQWRHGQRSKTFDFELWFHVDPGTHSGLLSIGVHAANLTHPVTMRLPVAITVTPTSCLTYATAMVDAAKNAPKSFRLALG